MDDVQTIQEFPQPARPFEPVNWAQQRAEHRADEKQIMAEHWARHGFMVPRNSNPESEDKQPFATILVNPGTTPNAVVTAALDWFVKNSKPERFNVTWHTPGALVPETLRAARAKNPTVNLTTVTKLFLFPGLVNLEFQCSLGDEAVSFVKGLEINFTYAILSANSFDVESGDVYFQIKEEIPLQQACAARFADHKFLFFDSTKFKKEGRRGYNLKEILREANSVTVYTVSSDDRDDWVKYKFARLADSLLTGERREKSSGNPEIEEMDKKELRLQIVSKGETSTFSKGYKGFLIE